MQEMKIAPLLGRGEESAVSTLELVKRLGLHDSRTLRTLIERERADGVLILSTVRGRGGYFLPSSDPSQAREELAAFIRTVHARAVNSQRALRAARRALRECDGQTQIQGGVFHEQEKS